MARTVGASWKKKIKILTLQAKANGVVGGGAIFEYVKDELPVEAFETWEGAYCEIENLTHDFIMESIR